jgi:hypothetical protein
MGTSIAARRGRLQREAEPIRGSEQGSIAIRTKAPFNLPLSLAAAASFLPIPEPASPALVLPILLEGAASVVRIWQPSLRSSLCRVCASPSVSPPRLRRFAKWLISADLDLRPFLELAELHPILGPVAASLGGLKPLRPFTLFEMAVTAITEQQLTHPYR